MKKHLLCLYAGLLAFGTTIAKDKESAPFESLIENPGGQVTATYTAGDISADMVNVLQGISTANNCPATLSVNVPAGNHITSVNVSYSMESYGTTNVYSQYSLLRCVSNNTSETSLTQGTGALPGTANYSRNNLSIANGLSGSVIFELRAWWKLTNETPGGCGTEHAKVTNGSWTITVNYSCTPPAPPAVQALYTFCNESVPTLSQIGIEHVPGATLKWYHYFTNTELDETAVAGAGAYQVSQILGECESDRVNFDVVIPTVLAPEVSNTTFCYGAMVAELATPDQGGSISWTINATEVMPSALLTNGSYTGIRTISGCQSEPLTVTITVNNTPQPEVPTTQLFCEGATVANLVDTPNTQWYLNDILLSDNLPLISGTYVAKQLLNNCQSAPRNVTVTIGAIPTLDAPLQQVFCGGTPTIADLEVHPLPGATLVWSDGGDVIYPVTTPLPQSGSYSVTQTVNGCESAPIIIFSVLYPLPASPIVTNNLQSFNEGAIVYDLNFQLNATADGNNFYIMGQNQELQPVNGDDLLIEGQTYYITSKTIAGCESSPVTITVNQILGTKGFDHNAIRAFPIPVKDIITFTGTNRIIAIKIYNMLGQEVIILQQLKDSVINVNMDFLPSGAYIAKVESEIGISTVTNIIKQ